MKNDLITNKIQEWTIRIKEPQGEGPHPVIWLFHGWKGDEDSMSIFTSLLPDEYLVLAPRGPYALKNGGYSWYPDGDNQMPMVEDFIPALQKLKDLEDSWPLTAPWGDFNDIRLAGFSQGAAMAYTYMVLYPERVRSVAGLAGFLPADLTAEYMQNPPNYSAINVYISHGKNDEIVPIKEAIKAARFFEGFGANVTFCESDVNHKLNKECFNGLESFFQ